MLTTTIRITSNPQTPKTRAHHAPVGVGSGYTKLAVVIVLGKRPATFRTRKLSPTTPMVLHPTGCGRVGNRRNHTTKKVGGRAFGKGGTRLCSLLPDAPPPTPLSHTTLNTPHIAPNPPHANTQPGGKPGLLLQRRTTPPTTRKHTKLYRHQHRPRGHTEQTGNNTPTFSTTTSGAPAPQAADKSKHSHTNPNLPFNTQTTTSDSSTTPNRTKPEHRYTDRHPAYVLDGPEGLAIVPRLCFGVLEWG